MSEINFTVGCVGKLKPNLKHLTKGRKEKENGVLQGNVPYHKPIKTILMYWVSNRFPIHCNPRSWTSTSFSSSQTSKDNPRY